MNEQLFWKVCEYVQMSTIILKGIVQVIMAEDASDDSVLKKEVSKTLVNL